MIVFCVLFWGEGQIGAVGEPVHISVRLRDECGRAVPAGCGALPAVLVRREGREVKCMPLHADAEGYTVVTAFNPSQPGYYLISVHVDGSEVVGSPARVKVRCAALSLSADPHFPPLSPPNECVMQPAYPRSSRADDACRFVARIGVGWRRRLCGGKSRARALHAVGRLKERPRQQGRSHCVVAGRSCCVPLLSD